MVKALKDKLGDNKYTTEILREYVGLKKIKVEQTTTIYEYSVKGRKKIKDVKTEIIYIDQEIYDRISDLALKAVAEMNKDL